MSQDQGRILVIRGGAIGDFILTLPAIAALRERFPGVHLEILGYPHIAQLALAGGLVDRLQPIEAQALAGFFALGGTLSEDWRDYFSEFDLIVSYLFDPDEIFQDNIARCSPAQFIAGPHRAGEADGVHATQVYLKPLERLAIFDADAVPHLALNLEPATLDQLALHPGSGSERKNWPEPRWSELLALLVERTALHLLVVGGEAEGDRLERLVALLPEERVTLARSRPLVELAGLLQRCSGFVGHDSGITHLAAAVGLPSLVLLGDTIEKVWRPQGDSVRILRAAGGAPAFPVEQVWTELQEMISG